MEVCAWLKRRIQDVPVARVALRHELDELHHAHARNGAGVVHVALGRNGAHGGDVHVARGLSELHLVHVPAGGHLLLLDDLRHVHRLLLGPGPVHLGNHLNVLLRDAPLLDDCRNVDDLLLLMLHVGDDDLLRLLLRVRVRVHIDDLLQSRQLSLKNANSGGKEIEAWRCWHGG